MPTSNSGESSKSSEIEELRLAINQLTRSFNDMKGENRSRSKSRSNKSNQKNRSSSAKLREDRICRYHQKFGAEAYLCTIPCAFVADKNDSKN